MTAGEAHHLRESRRLALPRALAVGLIHTSVIQSQWGEPGRVLALVAFGLVHVIACAGFGRFNRVGSAPFSALRTLAYLLPEVASGFVSGWANPVLFFVLFNPLSRDEVRDGPATLAFATSTLALGGLALAHGFEPKNAVGLLCGAVVAHLAIGGRMLLTRNLVDDLAARNEALVAAQAELRQYHEQAVRHEKLSSLGLLAAGIAHEINNPMSYVTANVRAVLEELRPRAEGEAALREIVEEILPQTLEGARRVNSIVADMRLFARGDPQGMTDYDLNEQIELATRIVRSSVPPHCTIALDLGVLPRAVGFPRQIAQVLVNLLVNAAQASDSEQPSTVDLRSRVDAEWLIIEIQDRGVGISDEVRARLFEPFFTTKPVGKGTGLGLSVAYGIVRTHQGRIEVESEVGRGSTFRVWLPREPGLARLDRAGQAAADGR